MPEKPVVDIPVLSVLKVTISTDPAEGAIIDLITEADADIRLKLPQTALAQLEVMLARVAQEQSKHQPRQ